MFHRKNINDLTPVELGDYVHALSILRQRSRANPDDQAGYDYQAGLHNDMEIGPCEHGSDLFFGWHRCHLYYFEKLLRATDAPRTANVSIPYWDWSRPDPAGRYPRAFSMPELSSTRFTDGPPVHADTLKIVIDERNWNEFAGWPKGTPGRDYGSFEYRPHNFMHPQYIGGVMGNPATAALDPIYWSFHCFIDLCWYEWQRRNPGVPSTSPQAGLRGFDGKPRRTIADFESTADLEYDYVFSQALAADLQRPSPARLLDTTTAAGSAKPLFSGSLQDSLLATSSAAFQMPRLTAGPRRAVLVLNDLSIPNVASFAVEVYVHPKSQSFATLTADQKKQFYADTVYIWKAHAQHPGAGAGDRGGHAGHGGHGGSGQPLHPTAANLRLDVTRLMTVGDDLAATLILIPSLLSSGEAAPRTQLIKQISLRDLTMEVV